MRQMVLALMLLLSGCVSSSYMGIPLTTGNADPTVQDLAIRARSGDKQAQLDLGIRFEEGRDVRQNIARALKLYRLAASDSGGTMWAYVPPTAKGQRGKVVRVNRGPNLRGLDEARRRLQELEEMDAGR